MAAVVLQGGERFYHEVEVSVPEWVVDLESFRRWHNSDDFPKTGRIDYIQGAVWVDMSMEQVFTHVLAKTEFTVVLGGMVKAAKLGLYLTDGLRLSNDGAELSSEPDGTFISNECMDEGNIQLIEARGEGYTEIEGVPDMVLEIISNSSVKKDTKLLFNAYWETGIKEYWLVDVRGERLSFDIFRYTAKGFIATRKQGGWLKSHVFGKSFRLTRGEDRFGNPEYTLDAR